MSLSDFSFVDQLPKYYLIEWLAASYFLSILKDHFRIGCFIILLFGEIHFHQSSYLFLHDLNLLLYNHFFSYLTTEIRDFERSEEIPLQLMVMFRFNYWRLPLRSIHFVSSCICDLFILLASASAICSKMNILISIRESQSVQNFCPTSLGFSHD